MEPREYERTASVEDAHWWFRELRMIWSGLLEIDPRHSDTKGIALDAGCGTGGNLRYLRRTHEAIGIDLSPRALRLARERVGHPLVQASVSTLPFRSGRFDLILCTDVLYHSHVENDAAALSELLRNLRPGGRLIVNLPAFESLRSAHDRAMHTARRYSRGHLSGLLEDAGFRVIRVTYWNGLLFAPAVLLRLLRRGRGNRSELVDLPRPVNGLLTLIARCDAALAIRGLLPLGLSVAAIAERPK